MTLHRQHTITRAARAAGSSGDLTIEMAFASSAPVERWFGTEVLDVNGARLARLNDGAPLLFNHDWQDLRGVHVPGSVRAEADGVLRGQVRITAATQAGRDTIGLVEGDILTKASVGYEVHKVVEVTTGRDGAELRRDIDGPTFERLLQSHGATRDAAGFRRELDRAAGPVERAGTTPPVYLVTDWEPIENSLVTVPADNSVGVGRSHSPTAAVAAIATAAPAASIGVPQMGQEQNTAAGNPADDGTQSRAHATGQAGAGGNRAVELEQGRRRAIENLCKANNIDANIRDHWIGTGLAVESITEDLLQILETRGKNNPQSQAALGLSDSEANRFSMWKAVRAVADKNWSDAGFELECSRAIAKRLNVVSDPNKFFVPFEVQQRAVAVPQSRMPQRRDLTVATASAGGYLVSTQNMSFIEMLRNRSVAYRMGARRLAGLMGNVTIPRQSGAATAVWLANEASTITESQQVIGQMALSPKNVGAYTEISRQLLLQSSPDAEGMVTADLAAVAALAVDAGVLNGSGASGQPTGIANTAGIGSVTGTSLGYAGILEFQTDIATANVVPAMGGYATTPTVAALMMQRQRFSSTDTPLWQGNIFDGQMAGFAAMSSMQMTAATMMFGDWSQVVVAEWGVLEIEVNPYANFQAGIIGVRAIVSVDCGLRYPGAFSLATTIT